MFIIFVIPFATRFTTPQTVEADSRAVNGTAGYTVVLNGTPIGCTQDEETARTALQNVRGQLNEEYGTTVYADTELEIFADDNIRGRLLDENELEQAMYSAVNAVAHVPENLAYTVRIDDYMVTVGSEAEVVELLEAAKNRIAGEDAGAFQVELVDSTDNGLSHKTVNVATADITMMRQPRCSPP